MKIYKYILSRLKVAPIAQYFFRQAPIFSFVNGLSIGGLGSECMAGKRQARGMIFRREGVCVLLLLLTCGLCGCSTQTNDYSERQPVSKTIDGPLDTVSTITLYEWDGGEDPIDDIFNMLYDINKRMSAFSADSEIAALSGHVGTPQRVSRDIYDLIAYAKDISVLTEGAFDISIRPVIQLWGIGTENERIPSQREIDSILPIIGYENITLNKSECSIAFENDGMHLDLGAIAKGYACDEAVKILKNAGVNHAIIDMGGNIYAYNKKADDSPWRVGIKSPLVGENGYFAVIEAVDKAVVTSGVYERYFERDGQVFHHIMDPKSGYPVNNGLISVTVVADSSALADTLSTACFVLGIEKGMECLDSFPGVQGIFVSEDLTVCVTPELRGMLKITDDRFRLVDYHSID